MSIRQETFKEKMAEAKMLLGSPMKVEAFNAIWDRFKDSFTTSDFSQAMDIVDRKRRKTYIPGDTSSLFVPARIDGWKQSAYLKGKRSKRSSSERR